MNDRTKEQPEELLGELEQIRELLDEDEQSAESTEDGVPVLEEVIDGAISVSEQGLDARAYPGDSSEGVLPDAAMDALLGEAWKAGTSEILDTVRAAIGADRIGWAPQDTDELHEALKVRIDDAIVAWIGELVEANIESLRAGLVKELTAALREHLQDDTEKTRTATREK
ncbi:MAG: hypothetical protein QF921_15105 [Pseudomonadales bacterium]|nr:hypothetical protein [Pseudomonadales bacterium]MDP6471615.1 hypothetical protein [Pseudomonadales bacterium]MDP6828878.1 hypothetical protein [Pseudomonadales bacterium]MDP6972810.1 hypothetical protein [Pseudomonadales bacterium]